MLSASGHDDSVDENHFDAVVYPPVLTESVLVAEQEAAAALQPLSSIPALNSLPGATASLYLDFDGHFDSQWGSYQNISTPAFDKDGDPTTFSDSELATISQVWSIVAEDYAPFKINVTTVQPPSFANKVALRVVIGGDGAWSGSVSGGIGYINAFTNSVVNSAYVFSKNLGAGNARYTAEAASHEAGHSFGLQHQSQYSGTQLVNTYYAGPGDGRAPIMGVSYYATRGLWWNGTSTSSTTIQDDMTLISRTTNGFGYRTDDHGSSRQTATSLTAVEGEINSSGIIGRTDDSDYFSFETDAGTVNLQILVPFAINNLDSRLELFDDAGALIAASAPAGVFTSSVTATLAAGVYYAAVLSQGSYGDVGQYTLTGTVATPPPPPPAVVLGDMNGDGVLNNFDLQALEIALTQTDVYTEQYPLVLDYHERGDINGSGTLDNFDIQPFERLLTPQGSLSVLSGDAGDPITMEDSAAAALAGQSRIDGGEYLVSTAAGPKAPMTQLPGAQSAWHQIGTANDSLSDAALPILHDSLGGLTLPASAFARSLAGSHGQTTAGATQGSINVVRTSFDRFRAARMVRADASVPERLDPHVLDSLFECTTL